METKIMSELIVKEDIIGFDILDGEGEILPLDYRMPHGLDCTFSADLAKFRKSQG